jgi:hypothetical protein
VKKEHCRLCWCQARLDRSAALGGVIGTYTALLPYARRVRHHQLFLAGLPAPRDLHPKPQNPRRGVGCGSPGVTRRQPPPPAGAPQVDWIQPALFDPGPRDYHRRVDRRSHPTLDNPWLAWGLHLGHTFAEARGFATIVYEALERALVMLLADHTAGDMIRYSDIHRALRPHGNSAHHAAYVLAQMGLLDDDRVRAIDVVAPVTALRAEGAQLVLSGTQAQITEDGVTPTDGVYLPTEVFDEGLAAKLNIPSAYLRRLRQARPDLYDANINGWLRDPGESRSFLVRCFRGDNGPGIARALLSDRYGILDNLDVLMAALDGVRRAGIDVEIDGCDLSERRMYVRVVAPQIKAFAPDLLAGYRSPWGGQNVGNGWPPQRVARAARSEGEAYAAGEEPIVFSGFEITNSEVGNGRFTITPRLTVQTCGNGLTITAEALSKVHVGARLDEGIIKWSRDTEARALELVTAQARDAVEHYLNPQYVKEKVAQIEAKAARPVTDAPKTVEVVSKALSFTPAQQTTILDHFIRGGQLTAGGIMQAVTSAAQTMQDADVAHAMEAAGLRALALAATGR